MAREWQTKTDNTAPTDTGVLTAAEDNSIGEEQEFLVESAGITPVAYNAASDPDTTQWAQAVARYASGAIFGTDGGSANTYVVSITGAFQAPKAYFTGMTIDFYPAANNSGASTVNAFGLGVKKVFDSGGSALTGNEIVASQLTSMVYDAALDSAAGAFKIKPWAEAAVAGASSNHLNLPIFPEVNETDYKLVVSNNGGGVLEVAASQTFTHRGWTAIETDDFSAGNRQLSTTSSKTYHVRWHASGTGDATPAGTYPNGRFVIKDLADAGYNPSTLAEANAAFDTTYDDMLIARVVTDGSNVPTITSLANRARLGFKAEQSGTPTDPSPFEYFYVFDFSGTLNWARTPTEQATSGHCYAGSGSGGTPLVSGGTRISGLSVTRYGYAFSVGTDWDESMGLPGSFDCKVFSSFGA